MATGYEENKQRAFPAPVPPELTPPNPLPVLDDEYNIPAIVSMCCGLLGLFVFQIVLAPVAIVCGAFGVHTAKRSMPSTLRLAISGYGLGIVDGVVWLVLESVFHVALFPL